MYLDSEFLSTVFCFAAGNRCATVGQSGIEVRERLVRLLKLSTLPSLRVVAIPYFESFTSRLCCSINYLFRHCRAADCWTMVCDVSTKSDYIKKLRIALTAVLINLQDIITLVLNCFLRLESLFWLLFFALCACSQQYNKA